uniref:Vesicle transport through interaction with t-SNAREs 1A n=2 Tax=Eptatretus burgeri TaxID=7764 RepID=A0A8C4NGH8_EPTBU
MVEQMELEERERSRDGGILTKKSKACKKEMDILQKELRQARVAYSDDVLSRTALLGDETDDPRAVLLSATDRLENSSRDLERGFCMTTETEAMGRDILGNLSRDRETMQRARERLRETDAGLGQGSRILTSMMRRAMQNKVILIGIGLLAIVVISLIVYFSLR